MRELLCQSFQAVMQKNGNGMQLTLPFDPASVWGARDRYDITGTIAGHTYRGRVHAVDGSYVLRFGAAWCRDNPISVGMQVDVVVTLEGVQIQQMADDLSSALRENPAAQRFFESLPTFYRKNYLRWIDSAKQPATRAKRISELLVLLAAEQRER